MPVPMMHIRKMRMAVPQRTVHMHMAVGLSRIPLKPMLMLVMFIMHMPMSVLHGLMLMIMGMPFRQVQPHTHGHQRRCNPESQCH